VPWHCVINAHRRTATLAHDDAARAPSCTIFVLNSVLLSAFVQRLLLLAVLFTYFVYKLLLLLASVTVFAVDAAVRGCYKL
jgi:hypothetical protein